MIERYSRPEMSSVWEDKFKYDTWLKIEILACEARSILGDIPEEDVKVIKAKARYEINEVLEIENTTQHDVIAFLTNVASYVGTESRHIHYGMTSSDILDTTLSFQMKTAGEKLLDELYELRSVLQARAVEHKNTLCIGRTHGVHAEMITMGLKFALWYEEIKRNIQRLQNAIEDISVGQISGAVGTFDHLSPFVEAYVCERMGLKPAPISTQVLQRDRHANFLFVISLIGSTIEKITTEIRHLQKTEVLEAEEHFGSGQKGSSAMPHKRNPIICERLSGMARILRGNLIPAIENNALWHERDISHSSVERVIIPDSCILLDYMLHKTIGLIRNLIIYPDNMIKNINLTRGLLFSQKVLLKLVEKGLVREEAYKIVQDSAMRVWRDETLHLKSELTKDEKVSNLISKEELDQLFNLENSLTNIDEIFNRTVLNTDE